MTLTNKIALNIISVNLSERKVEFYDMNDGIGFAENDILKNKKLGYIYATSGSSGIPKYVLGNIESLKKFLFWQISFYNINEDNRFINVTRPTFDPYLRDILTPFLAGSTIFIPDELTVLNRNKMGSYLINNKIDSIHATPSYFINLDLSNDDIVLKNVFLAGEKIFGAHVKNLMHLLDKNVKITNLYGPTETTLAKFHYEITKKDSALEVVPVGKAFDDSEAVIDGDKQIIIKTKTGSLGYYDEDPSGRFSFEKIF